MVLAFLGVRMSDLVLASRDNLLPECILFKTILTNNVQNGSIVYGALMGNTFDLHSRLVNKLWCSEFTGRHTSFRMSIRF